MEDISRELEREIAKAKPTPYRTRRDEKILIVDEFGGMRSGGYLKTLARIFIFISLGGVLVSGGLYYLYSRAKQENISLKAQLAVVQKKADRMAGDREILMARLVMAGQKVALETPAPDRQERSGQKPVGTQPEPTEKDLFSNQVSSDGGNPAAGPDRAAEVLNDPAAAGGQAGTEKKDTGENTGTPQSIDPTVSIEKFSVTRGSRGGELIVRFNIRNISKTSKEVAGRVFAVLNSGNTSGTDGVVVPAGTVENGVPGPYSKGQYFSITRFKPVRFTVKSQAAPEGFKTATVYVFGDDKRLMFKNTMAVNGEQ